MCSRCNEAGRWQQCAACRAQPATAPGYALSRQRILWGELLGISLRIYRQNFGLVSVAVLLTAAPLLIGQLASSALQLLWSDDFGLVIGLSLLIGIAQLLAQALAWLGLLGIGVRLARGEPAELSMLLSGLPRLGALLLQGAAIQFALMFAAGCAFAPVVAVFALSDEPALSTVGLAGLVAALGTGAVIYVALGFAFASFELAAQPGVGPFAAIGNAWAIARGERLTIAFGLLLAFGLALLGMLVCFVGLIFTLGYATLLLAVLYVALRNGAELPR
jgi:hypothetical protein